jgi:uncharacterized SAM-binding protein YcdF (DUF218 family)
LVAKVFSALLLPPASFILLGLAGLLVLSAKPRLGKSLIGLCLGLLYLLAMPLFAEWYLNSLEVPPLSRLDPQAQAIVVLGAGTYFAAPEYGGDTVYPLALERLRYAAKLQRETGKPILASGGKTGSSEPESLLMKQVLENGFRVPVRWTETKSRTTRENASLSLPILKEAGITHVYLVTHAWHMERAAREFRRTGMQVTQAPTGFTTRSDLTLLYFIPSARALLKSYYATHEVMGLVWYWLLSL